MSAPDTSPKATDSRRDRRAHDALTAASGGAYGPEDVRLRHETRVAMLSETLQLAKYSAITQAAVALALAYMFRDIAPNGYMASLATAVTLLCAATLAAARHYRGTFREAATELAVRRGFLISKFLALSLGLSWASMPAVLLPSMDNAYRVIVVAVCAGLVSDAYVVGPIFGVAVLLAAPVVVGLFVGLLGCEAPVGEYIAVLLAVYATFVFLSARRMCGLSYQRLLDRAVVQEQSETIGLLLKDFEEGTSDWLWETDAAGRLRNSRRRFAALLGRDAEDLRDHKVLTLLREFATEGGARGDVEAVVAAVEARLPFPGPHGQPAHDGGDALVDPQRQARLRPSGCLHRLPGRRLGRHREPGGAGPYRLPCGARRPDRAAQPDQLPGGAGGRLPRGAFV